LSAGRATVEFNVKYIGQAFGKDGSRNAIDRLKKHETLQKISLLGAPDGYVLSILLLEIQPSNQVFSFFNPFAADKSQGKERIQKGMEKLHGTNEHERITLYEASLIRYFRPQYNIEFKDSFPSTNMKVLHDCYEKDFSAVIAEICFDDVPILIRSETVEAKPFHFAVHDLHDDENRKTFFSGFDSSST